MLIGNSEEKGGDLTVAAFFVSIFMNMEKLIRDRVQKFLLEHEKKISFPQFWYHGTNELFDQFSSSFVGKNFDTSTLGVYFSQYASPPPYSSTAEEYAKAAVSKHGGKPYIYKCTVSDSNPLVLGQSGWYSSNAYVDKNRNDIKRWLSKEGKQTVVVYDEEGIIDGIEYADFILVTSDLSSIKILDVSEVQ